MPATKVGSHQSREKLATHVLHGEGHITHHGDTIGYVFPARPKRTVADWRRLQEAADKVDQQLAAAGVTEEEIIADIELALKGQLV
jgi:hypothetical protein